MSSKTLAWAALSTVLWSVLMMAVFPYPLEHRFHHDLDSPVLALELAHDQSDIDAVLLRKFGLRSVQRSITWNTHLDLVFIPLYVWYLISLGSGSRLVKIFAIGAGLFDYVEDALIYRTLGGGNPPVYLPSLAKWGLLALTLLLLSRRIDVFSLATRRLLALAHAMAGGIMLSGVIAGEWIGYSWIELGAKIFAFTAVVTTIGLWGPYIGHWFPGKTIEPLDDFCGKRSKPVIH